MKIVAIISEYNPFHNGHKYQIDKIREEFGSDTAVIAVMSGNFTQRGELAFMDKWERALAAVKCGVNLVLELPFPYSMSSADFFARAGIKIILSLGCVDVISFGSECGDIDLLKRNAVNMLTDEFKNEIKKLKDDENFASLGYARLCDIAYKNCFSVSPVPTSPNNILAIEYIKAALLLSCDIDLHTVKRLGSDYNEENITDEEHQSATAIRNKLLKDLNSAKNFVPKNSFDIISKQMYTNGCPISEEKIGNAVLANFRLNLPTEKRDIHDAGGGLYNRLIRLSHEATTLSAIKELAATKKYTNARIRRAIWYSYFGVTSSDVKELPEYTQILAMDKVGQAILKKARKTADITILNKPSKSLSSVRAKRTKELSDKADMIVQLAKPEPMPSSAIHQRTPYVID